MGVKIHIPAEDIWTFFFRNKERCREEMIEIAVNEDTKYTIYLTEEYDYPMFAVFYDNNDEAEYEEGAISRDDCLNTAKRVFADYLFPVTVKNEKAIPAEKEKEKNNTDPDEEYAEQCDDVLQRDDELTLALLDFLKVVFETETESVDIFDDYGEETIAQILDDFLDCLADQHGFTDIRRPTFIVDEESGIEFYTEHPYDPNVLCEIQSDAAEIEAEKDIDGE